jgi:hypothetical protein
LFPVKATHCLQKLFISVTEDDVVEVGEDQDQLDDGDGDADEEEEGLQ